MRPDEIEDAYTPDWLRLVVAIAEGARLSAAGHRPGLPRDADDTAAEAKVTRAIRDGLARDNERSGRCGR